MNLADLETALHLHLADASLQQYHQGWINAAILELATDYDLPALKLLTPATFPVVTSTWFFQMPTNYHKGLFRCVDSDYNDIEIYDEVKSIEDMDLDHDETGDHVTHVAVTANNELAVYPLANESLHIWYYRLPMVLVNGSDIPDLMPPAFHERVILCKCLIKGYEHLQDQVENFDPKPLQYWRGKLAEGLFGGPRGEIGLFNYLAKAKGGAKRVGGPDPIGARGW